ncbi:efflux RND transporter periplasmic adaptor subunit [Chryseolinea lacunae]|uniref:Efflux RND transporter periplasmic adaptor subunit n=1 Tax=Chryseolinea lacunae TaxID=2801331 RepID=A0ABS1KY24_9BACT|nr:efflux RND transporter periplasmic adaptor subunit [Chryseolinea lacunae]MBL0744167.1 efflux RND transporter periplasmic adaptor subunit [Chryseolinea lacunae]
MKVLIHICLLAFSGTFFFACNESRASRNKDTLPELEVMTLRAQNISIPRAYICQINAVQYVEIHARVQGYLEDIYIDEGQLVRKGQPLFRISSNEYKEMVIRAEANVQRALAEAKAKSLEVERIALMVDKHVISESQLQVAKAQLDAASSGVGEARSVLENAKINLNYTFIRAPFDGVIDRIPFKKGSLINSGTLLTSLSNIDEVFAYFKVSETEYLQLLGKEIKGRKINAALAKISLVLADGSPYPLKGTIETIEGDFDRETGSIAIRARFSNPDFILKHGASGKVLLQRTWNNALLVPEASAFTIQDKNYVYMVDKNNIARARNFNTLARFDHCFVVSGLSPGERILLEGLQQIHDGQPVKPKAYSADSIRISRQ